MLQISVSGAIMPSLHFETGGTNVEDAEMKIWQVEVRATVYGDFHVKAHFPETAKELATALFNAGHEPPGWSTGTLYQFTVIGEAEPDDIEDEYDVHAIEGVDIEPVNLNRYQRWVDLWKEPL